MSGNLNNFRDKKQWQNGRQMFCDVVSSDYDKKVFAVNVKTFSIYHNLKNFVSQISVFIIVYFPK